MMRLMRLLVGKKKVPFFKGSRGNILVGLVSVFGVGFILNSAAISLVGTRMDQQKKYWYDFAAREMAESSFAVLEAALQRRMWEPPPDENCLKTESMSATFTVESGDTITVNAIFLPEESQYLMSTVAPARVGTITVSKRLKVVDASDFLLLNVSSNEVVLNRELNDTLVPTGYLARDKRIQVGGRISFSSIIPRTSYSTNFSTYSPLMLPRDPGIILQADRIVALGGLRYTASSVPAPENSTSSVYSALEPYFGKYGQAASGGAYLTNDINAAQTIMNGVKSNLSIGFPLPSDLKKRLYPISLFCGGSLPFIAAEAADTGCYYGDPDQYVVFNYLSVGDFTQRLNATCISDSKESTCSDSSNFPKGFAKWRDDAGLNGTIFTDDGKITGLSKLDWDSFESLEEDAKACGLVVDTGTSLASEEDCDISDTNTIVRYISKPGESPCSNVYKLNSEFIPKMLNNLSLANYSDPKLENRLMRRVIYSKVPLEISQTMSRGLMENDLGDAGQRSKFSLMIVNEDKTVLRPIQPDTTSPLDDPTGATYRRKVFFNSDSTDADPLSYPPINLTLLSPEGTQMVSPFHAALDYSGLQHMWPVSGGKIVPNYMPLTDYRRQEDDAFKYGFREVFVQNLSVITSHNPTPGAQEYPMINLRGVWAFRDSVTTHYIPYACLFDEPGDSAGLPAFYAPNASGTGAGGTWQPIPARASEPDSMIPPPTSRFYGSSPNIPRNYIPDVFNRQRDAGQSHSSEVFVAGMSLRTKFENGTASGKRDLSKRKYVFSDTIVHTRVNMSNRRVYVNAPPMPFWKDTGGAVDCSYGNVKNAAGNSIGMTLYGNRDLSSPIVSQPTDHYSNAGAVFATELPVLVEGL